MKNPSKARIMILVGTVALALFQTGCVQTMYTKSVSVKKDAAGNVLEITESEAVSQPGQQSKYISFDHLKARSADSNTMEPK